MLTLLIFCLWKASLPSSSISRAGEDVLAVSDKDIHFTKDIEEHAAGSIQK